MTATEIAKRRRAEKPHMPLTALRAFLYLKKRNDYPHNGLTAN